MENEFTQDDLVLNAIRGEISKLTPEEQGRISLLKKEIYDLLSKHPKIGQLTFALVGAELAASQ